MTTKQQRTDTLASDPERDREVARRCLARLDPNCDRDTWVKVGMALRSVGPDMEQEWHSWSSGSPKYRQAEAARQWRDFTADGGIQLGTLTRMACLTTEELRGIGVDSSNPTQRTPPVERRNARTPRAGGEAAGADAPSFDTLEEAIESARYGRHHRTASSFSTHAETNLSQGIRSSLATRGVMKKAQVLLGVQPLGWPETGRWRYRDDWYQVRIQPPNGKKQFRPVSRGEDGRWRVKAPEHRTLYRVEQLPTDPDAVVLVTEGEKCADIAAGLGFAAVTCANGAQSPHKSDWSPMKGRTVVLLPDHDDDGKKFAESVNQELTGLGCTVSVVELPGLKDGEDIEQWRDAHGDDAAAALRSLIESSLDPLPIPDSMTMLDKAVAWCDQHQGREFVGLPCGVLPKLDRMLDGFRGLVILSGAPGCGKTTMVLQGAIGVATQNPDAAVLVVSCEMSRQELMHRLLCMHSDGRLDWAALVKGQGISREERERAIGEARSTLEPALSRVQVVEQAELSRLASARGGDIFVLMRQLVRQLKRRTGCTRGMVVIDNFATLPVGGDFSTDLERERFVSNRLLELQELTGDAVLVIAQQNKEAMKSEGRSMAGVKGAVEIIYAADAVLLLTKFNGSIDSGNPSVQHLRVASQDGTPLPIIRCSVPKGRDGMSRRDLLMLFDHERSMLIELDRSMVNSEQQQEGDDGIPF